jgi:oligoendopeptidase F
VILVRMRMPANRALIGLVLMTVCVLPLSGQERERSQVPDQYKWNVADIYPDDAAWRAAKEKIAADIPQLRQYQGKLGTSPATLADALDRAYALNKELSRTYTYASLLADQDTRDSSRQGMAQEMTQLGATFSAATSFLEPEILKLRRVRPRG